MYAVVLFQTRDSVICLYGSFEFINDMSWLKLFCSKIPYPIKNALFGKRVTKFGKISLSTLDQTIQSALISVITSPMYQEVRLWQFLRLHARVNERCPPVHVHNEKYFLRRKCR